MDNLGQWTQQAYIKASNTQKDDEFARSVSISGDSLVVGALYEKSVSMGLNGDQADNSAIRAGAAYYYIRDGSGGWSQQQYIKGSNTESNDLFGQFVAIDGTTIMIASQSESSNARGVNGNQGSNTSFQSGAVYIFNTETQ